MSPQFFKSALAALLLFPFCLQAQSRLEDRKSSPDESTKNSKNAKPNASGKRTVWNLDGGVFFSTDGHLPNGACFRLSGQVIAPEFFDGLRRVDSESDTYFTLRDKEVTTYPSEVQVVLHVLDYPCTLDLKDNTVRPPLTREMMSALRLGFFWKEGLAMRAVDSSKRIASSVRRLMPYSTLAAEELAPRFEWNFEFSIASENVPLTNDLVVLVETEDRKIAARVAARM
jgi:hypothetical protein